MKKWLKYVAAVFLILAELILIGCAMVPDLVIPCWIEPEAAEVADVNIPGLLPWTTLHDAQQVSRGLNYNHLMSQMRFARGLADENLKHDFLSNAHNLYIEQAEQFKEDVFSPTGPIGILLSGGALGGLMLFVDKPGTRKRLEQAKEEGKKEANGG